MSVARAALPPLLYLTHRLPYPPNKGDKVRSFNILRQLARHHRVFLGTFIDDPDDRRHLASLDRWCESVHAVEFDPRRRRLSSLRGLLQGEALSLPYYRDAGLARWVADTVAARHIRTALAFSGPMAQYLNVPGLSRRVVDFCDVDSAKWTQYAAERRWPLSWLYRREGRCLSRFERKAAAAADAALFVTAAEAELFRRAAPELAARIVTLQNGVDAEFFAPCLQFDNPYPAGGPVLLFTGAMDYWPNIDAVEHFVDCMLPAIRMRWPGARFWIVGMNPAASVQALADTGVQVTGTVPDVRPYMAHADVIVAPLRIARGIQNKVLEAMAMARPVVISTASATGLTAVPGRDCEIADSPAAFVARVMALLEQPERRLAMGVAARACVLDHYSWPAHLAQLDALLSVPVGVAGAEAEAGGGVEPAAVRMGLG